MTDPCAQCGAELVEGCDERGWLVSLDGGAGKARRCPSYLASLSTRNLSRAGIPPRYEGATCENFIVTGLQGSRQLSVARAACALWASSPTLRGFLMWGPNGTGKSRLAASLLHDTLLAHPGMTGRFVDFTELCSEIQATFDADRGDDLPTERELIEPLIKTTGILVVDELGARRPTDFALDTLYRLVNGRYRDRLPTIFTTNYPPLLKDAPGSLSERVGLRIMSRLWEMCSILDFDRVGDFRKRKETK